MQQINKKTIIDRVYTIFVLFLLGIISSMFFSFTSPNIPKVRSIQFFNSDWEEAKAIAKQENRAMFVVIYADWFEPCKNMVEEVFEDETVGIYYNLNFINYRIHFNSKLGATFREKYSVNTVPEFLFFDAEGNIIHRAIGVRDKKELLEMGQKALYKTLLTLENMQEKYADGYRYPEFLRDFAYKLKLNNLKYHKVVREYLEFQAKESLLNTEDLRFLFDFSDNLRNPTTNIMLENRKLFLQLYGEKSVERKIRQVIYETMKLAQEKRSKSLFNQVKKIIKETNLPDATKLLKDVENIFYENVKDTKNYAFF